MKVCSKCGKEKELTEYHKTKRNKDGLDYKCKDCCKEHKKIYYLKNKLRIDIRNNKYNSMHKNERRESSKLYRLKNKEKIYNGHRLKLKVDTNYKITCILRQRLNKALKNNYKVGSAVKDLGCSISCLKFYLTLLFQEGMTWDNYGRGNGTWQIDHIRPLSSFNLQDRKELLKACHYTNLQPLWEKDNLEKRDKILCIK